MTGVRPSIGEGATATISEPSTGTTRDMFLALLSAEEPDPQPLRTPRTSSSPRAEDPVADRGTSTLGAKVRTAFPGQRATGVSERARVSDRTREAGYVTGPPS